MSLIQAVILGLIQGMTEFLPVSSSGHLVIAQQFLGFSEPPLFFDVVVHGATLVAVLIFFRHQILKLNRKQISWLAVGSVPLMLLGIFLTGAAGYLFSSLKLVGVGLVATSVLVGSTYWAASKTKPVNGKRALIIGIFQALAIIPGVSRSGSTVVAALHLGIGRKEAFRFSFLLSIPAILGALIWQSVNIDSIDAGFTQLGAGFLAALGAGLLSLAVLKRLILSDRFHWFSAYTLVLGLGLLFFS